MAKRIVISKKPEQKDELDEALIGQWVRFIRTSVSLSIEDAAALASVSKQSFSDLENGKPGCSLGIMMKILNSLGIELSANIPAIQILNDLDEQ